MGRRRTYAAVPGDWKVWCIRSSHICMASQAVQLWDRHWVCEQHYEVRQPLDSLETKDDGEIAVGMTRGTDKVRPKGFDGTAVDGSDIGITTYQVAEVAVKSGSFDEQTATTTTINGNIFLDVVFP